MTKRKIKTKTKAFDKLLVTSMGAGYIPFAPGTMGAVVGVLIWCLYSYMLDNHFAVMLLTLALSVVFTVISIRPIDHVEKEWGHDPKRVVIDETVGVWVALLAVPMGSGWQYVAGAFVLFRFFDIVKPLGCRWVDRNIEGGWGVMLDDVLAGFYAGIVLTAIQFLTV